MIQDKNAFLGRQNEAQRDSFKSLSMGQEPLGQNNKPHSLENHILTFVRITERAALACQPLIGKGDSMKADERAVSAMRSAFSQLPMDILITIGEGERDKAPLLWTGERLGDKNSSLKWDVAVDPLEGTSLCAEGRRGALSTMAVSPRGGLLKAPDIYMKKLACGPKGQNRIDLRKEPQDNIKALAKALKKSPKDITVGMLDRPRHKDLAEKIRSTGARIRFVDDGDLSLGLECALSGSPIDLLMGTGGAPEGVLAAAGLKCLGGGFQAQLVYRNEDERQRAKKAGILDLDKIWDRDELASGDVLFFATGVTAGSLVEGLRETKEGVETHSLILSPKGTYQLKSLLKNPL